MKTLSVISAGVLGVNLILISISYLHVKKIINPTGMYPLDEKKRGGNDRLPSVGKTAYIRLHNSSFYWNDSVYVSTAGLDLGAVPVNGEDIVDLDVPESFDFHVYGGTARVDVKVLDALFNDRVLAYPGAPLRNIHIETDRDSGPEPLLVITGDIHLGAWMHFKLGGRISVNTQRNMLVLDQQYLRVIGMPVPPGLLDFTGLTLQKLIVISGGRGVYIEGNRLLLDLEVLLPHPSVIGVLEEVHVADRCLQITFARVKQIDFPQVPVKGCNYIQIYQGTVKLQRMFIRNAMAQLVDMTQEDYFEFNVGKYYSQVIRGKVRLTGNQWLIADIPDFSKVNEVSNISSARIVQ